MTNFSRYIFPIVAVISLFLGMQYARDLNQEVLDNQNSSEMTESKTIQEDSENVNPLSEFNNSIVDIAEKTNPTVVTITTMQTVTLRQRSPFSLFFDDPRFDREEQFEREGLGSGVIVSEDGYIITNNHVIENADEINVITYDGEEISAEIVGTDPASDVAVLKVDSGHNLHSVELGDSESLRVGEIVFAIGSPLNRGLAHTISMGIVSAKGRTGLKLNLYENYIQTDAAINPGNSGGALINHEGKLVGINTAIASRTGGNMGIGFAIPVNMAKSVMDQLISEGRVVRGFLGIEFGAMVDGTMAKALDLDRNYGVVIGSVESGGPADKAGLKEEDVILKADGEEVRNWDNFRLKIASKKPGDTVGLKIFRNGKVFNTTVELGELQSDPIASSDNRPGKNIEETLGFSVQDLTDNIRSQLGLRSDVSGVVVTEIQQTSQAYRQGLRRSDVITRVGNNNISSANQFINVLQTLHSDGEEVVLMRINRRGQNMFIAFELQ